MQAYLNRNVDICLDFVSLHLSRGQGMTLQSFKVVLQLENMLLLRKNKSNSSIAKLLPLAVEDRTGLFMSVSFSFMI